MRDSTGRSVSSKGSHHCDSRHSKYCTHIRRAVEGQNGTPNSFGLLSELRKCEILMPKKSNTTQTAAAVNEVEEEDLAQRLAAKIAVIQGRSGRFKGNDSSSAEKFVGKLLTGRSPCR